MADVTIECRCARTGLIGYRASCEDDPGSCRDMISELSDSTPKGRRGGIDIWIFSTLFHTVSHSAMGGAGAGPKSHAQALSRSVYKSKIQSECPPRPEFTLAPVNCVLRELCVPLCWDTHVGSGSAVETRERIE